ncbi:ABC-type amino acid transport signal transduction system, periplasmic component domain [Lactobacillus selangorensis]|uniref:ABC-type amino acid transport signal transduction system, periplasmic component domain n=1 Tax=Lactobacillus selangorensis TaxID=81857 RepID=A0A0R2FWI0_9LACO|nr:ABC-type amino acid transport signal transduction system, periplasmic component domain [Lactobacillus selangorensis]KRN32658.1 ABC-type amino acid transport signal transduction system, periplasmic component domain [Lactobacillus selangorensis]
MLALFLFIFAFALPQNTTNTSAAAKTAAEYDKDKTFRVGMEAGYAPFNWTQSSSSNGAVKIQGSSEYANGYDVQMAKKIAKALGKKLVIVKTDWNGLPPALTSGKIDAIIAGMSPTPARRKQIDFTNTYYKSKLCIVVRRNGKYANATSIQDFKGAKLTAQQNTFHYQAIKQIKGVKKQPAMNNFAAMRTSLQSGVIDGYVSEVPEGITAQNAQSDLKMIKFKNGKGFKTSPDDVDIAIGIRKGDPDKAKMNAALAKVSNKQRDKLMNWAVEKQPKTSSTKNWFQQIWDQYGNMILKGTGLTLWISLFGTVVGFLIGLLIGIVRTTPMPDSRGRRGVLHLIDWLLAVYIEIIRGTPMIVQAAVFYYGLAQAFGINMNRTVAALIIVSFNTGAYMAEIIRSGIISVNSGQFEAASALGMTHFQLMRKVVLPQAIRNSIPTITNEFIVNIKDTSVLSVISVSELFFQGETVAGQTFQFFHTYLIISVIYLVLTFSISRILAWVERRLDGPTNYDVMANPSTLATVDDSTAENMNTPTHDVHNTKEDQHD